MTLELAKALTAGVCPTNTVLKVAQLVIVAYGRAYAVQDGGNSTARQWKQGYPISRHSSGWPTKGRAGYVVRLHP